GFLAGTDELNPYCFPGFSLHDELALLVTAGLTPLGALPAATIHPPRDLHKGKSQGNAQGGKDADRVFLGATPPGDSHNTGKIHAVVANGRLYDRTALVQILDRGAAGQTPAKPAEAVQEARYSVLMAGRPCGTQTVQKSPEGEWRIVFEFNDRGRGPHL